MTEHTFLALLLAVSILEAATAIVVAVYYGYRIHKSAERTEGLTAATYLEAKKALTQAR